ncbi:MAG: GNAT family N-acetyltransferase [Bacteroidota bacterium]
MYSVRFVDHCTDIPPSLWDACFRPPREALWWYRALEGCGLEDQFTFFYGVIEQADGTGESRPVGIAPCFVADVPLELVVPEALMFLFTIPAKLFPSLAHRRTLFVGSPCADEGWVGVVDGVDRVAALLAVHDAAEAEARHRRAPMLVWKDIPQADKANLDQVRRQRRLFALPSYPVAMLRFVGDSKEDYFAALKGSRRHQLKKKLRTSRQHFQATTEVLHAPNAAQLDEIYALFQNTFERAEEKFERLNRRFFELLAAEPNVHFVLLREAERGAAVAMMMCFEVGDLIINKFVGFDYDRPKEWLLYFRLWEAALDWALSRGASGIQSGQTCYKPKLEQGHALVPLFNYGRHANRLVHWIYGKVAATITWQSLDKDLATFLEAYPELAEKSRP